MSRCVVSSLVVRPVAADVARGRGPSLSVSLSAVVNGIAYRHDAQVDPSGRVFDCYTRRDGDWSGTVTDKARRVMYDAGIDAARRYCAAFPGWDAVAAVNSASSNLAHAKSQARQALAAVREARKALATATATAGTVEAPSEWDGTI